MDSFYYSPYYRVLICVPCQAALTKSQLASHLYKSHRNAGLGNIQSAAGALAEQYPYLLPSQQAAASLFGSSLANALQPVPFLPGPYPDGRQCQACGQIFRTDEGIQKHCCNQHAWVNLRRSGRPQALTGTAHSVPWRTSVACQRLFATG